MSKEFKIILFFVNTYCNLHCENCSTLSHLPIYPDSPYLHRRERWEISLDEVHQFCEKLEGFSKNAFHRLLGGEPTALPMEKLSAIIDTLSSYGRKLQFLTNGFGILEMDKLHLDKIHVIEFDDHGINRAHIEACRRYLKQNSYQGRVIIRTQKTHYDLNEARKNPANIADKLKKPCKALMSPPSFFQGVFYPCCNGPCLEMYNNDFKMREELTASGWALSNPDIKKVLGNWEKHLPDYFKDQCLNHCWQPRVRSGTAAKISLKKNDVISRTK